MIYKNILSALIAQRPADQIIKVLNNKFAIVKSAYDNGKFADENICFLNNGTIYFYPVDIYNFTKHIKFVFANMQPAGKYRKTLIQAHFLLLSRQQADGFSRV